MRNHLPHLALALLIACAAAEACAPQVVFGPGKGKGAEGAGGDVSLAGATVGYASSPSVASSSVGPSTGSGPNCATFVGPTEPANCKLCVGAACAPNGCLDGDWCDTTNRACFAAPCKLAIPTPAGGVGGDFPTTNVGIGSATSGAISTGSGIVDAGPPCVDPNGTGAVTDASCDMIPAASAPHVCGLTMTELPPAVAACHRGFELYTEGAAEELATCLAQIPLGPGGANCNDDAKGGPIEACAQKVRADACPTGNEGVCDMFQDSCGGAPFDVATCKPDFAVLSNSKVRGFIGCFIGHRASPCQAAYQTCLAQAMAL